MQKALLLLLLLLLLLRHAFLQRRLLLRAVHAVMLRSTILDCAWS
jgi:hypothetical protein